ncbi:MAG: 50S ribosomal protein L1 [Spirochaetota bacterium]|jgi:large subunit ribosomal protein L1|nr:50S ribosomal protein L1 [Spirochaetota bacterium]
MKHSKRFSAAFTRVERGRLYSAKEAITLVRENAKAKFDESFDISITLNILAKHTIRDTFVLPHQSGKAKRVLVFAKGDLAKAAEAAGADFVGSDDLIEKIKGGWYDFDVAIATPDMMRDLGKLGPYLGKRGLMPNPKTGTVTQDVAKGVAEFKKGRTEFRADKKGVINLSLGRVSLDEDKLLENARVFFGEILRRRPSDLKGEYIRNCTLTSTMGPGVRIDWKSLS